MLEESAFMKRPYTNEVAVQRSIPKHRPNPVIGPFKKITGSVDLAEV
jgi:hypothetical protein